MIQHTQRDFGLGYGSCLATCFASVLDLPLEAVPNFVLFSRQWDAIRMWAEQKRLTYHFRHDSQGDISPGCFSCELPVPTTGLIVAGGHSPRALPGSNMGHAVVWDIDSSRVAWDPHPSGAGLAGPPERWYWFTPA